MSLLGSRSPIGATNQSVRELTMSSEQIIENDTLEIADLEYDVGGMSAEEPADSRASAEGWIVVMVTPK